MGREKIARQRPDTEVRVRALLRLIQFFFLTLFFFPGLPCVRCEMRRCNDHRVEELGRRRPIGVCSPCNVQSGRGYRDQQLALDGQARDGTDVG